MSIPRCSTSATAPSDEALVLGMQNLALEPSSVSSVCTYLTREDLQQTAQVCRAWRHLSLKQLSLLRYEQACIFREIVSFAWAWSDQLGTFPFKEINRNIASLKRRNFPSSLHIERLFVRIARSCASVLDIKEAFKYDNDAFIRALKNEIEQRVAEQEIDLETQKRLHSVCPIIAQKFTELDQWNWFFAFSSAHKSRNILRRLDLIRGDWLQIGDAKMAQFDIDLTIKQIFKEMLEKNAKPISLIRFIFSLCREGQVEHAINVAESLDDPEDVEEAVTKIIEISMLYGVEYSEELIQNCGSRHTSLYQRKLFEFCCEKFLIKDPDDLSSLIQRMDLSEPSTKLCLVKALLTRAQAQDIEKAKRIALKIKRDSERTEALQLVCETMCDNLDVVSARAILREISDTKTHQYLSTQIRDASISLKERTREESLKFEMLKKNETDY